jgi:hypothetical protein
MNADGRGLIADADEMPISHIIRANLRRSAFICDSSRDFVGSDAAAG